MQRILKKTDTFQILLKEHIDATDYQYLFMLYQPIIGVHAINLYLTLLQEKYLTHRTNLDFNHKRLMLLLNFDELELVNALKKLESFQLLTSYYHPLKSCFIYQLNKPLCAELFFAKKELKTTLNDTIGNFQFERQRYYFLSHQPKITEDFVLIESNNTFDKKINSNNLQNLLANLNQKNESISLSQIHPTSLKNNYQFYEQLKSNLETTTTNSSTQAKYNQANKTLVLMQEKNPEDYISNLTKKPIDTKLKNTLKLLTFDYNLNNDVINCLLEYVWFKNNKRFEPNYILKIGKTFHENNIDNIEDALNHLKLAYQKSKKHFYANKKKYQQDVLWTNDNYNFDVAKEENSNHEMNEKEISLILKEFDNY